jgi:outer membrane protein TolC
VALALRMRPEMNQARLQIRQGDVELVRTRSGLLPKLDAFLTLGPTGYASSFLDTFHKFDDGRYDATIGMQLTYPLGRRDEQAAHRRAGLQRDQAREALANLAQLVELDVRSGLIEITRAREQLTANAALRRLRAEALRVEAEKFKNGKSTSLLVAQTQRDFLASEVAEIAARAGFRKAVVRFYRAEGSLLQRRKLAAPGTQPIEPPDAADMK